ncbi:hypothetical protein CDD83_8612 [Cordyceps sp. RAO-2017]|nr:hypothetical protein CDD83_8612 [Cordyceps sp. RAO-2017]
MAPMLELAPRHIDADDERERKIVLLTVIALVALFVLLVRPLLAWALPRLSPHSLGHVQRLEQLGRLGRRAERWPQPRERDRVGQQCEDAGPARPFVSEGVPEHKSVEGQPKMPPPAYGSWAVRRATPVDDAAGIHNTGPGPRHSHPPFVSGRPSGNFEHAFTRLERQREQRLARWRRDGEGAVVYGTPYIIF